MGDEKVYKVMIAGDASVGKTTLLVRLVTGKFMLDLKMTIGVEFHLFKTDFDGIPITLQLWDLGGKERFRFIQPQYIRGTKLAILLYDLSNPDSITNFKEWVKVLRSQNPDLPILLVGQKRDLQDHIRVSDNDVNPLVNECNFYNHIKASSKDNIEIDKLVELVITKLLE
jgi:small GTP-binding protein